MLNLKRSFVVGLALLAGLLAISSVALAGHTDEHAEDTQFSFGYDLANHLLALNIGPNDTLWVCNFAQEDDDERLTATYKVDPDGKIVVDTLKDGGDVWSFDPRIEGLGKDIKPAVDPVDYKGTEGECVVHGVVVEGPNGQINHGQFMKAAKSFFNSLYEIQGQGCLVRHLAQSPIGKGNDPSHLTVSEAEASDWMFDGSGDGGVIDFTTVEADCNRGNKDKAPKAENANKELRSSKGKSGDAPGHNK